MFKQAKAETFFRWLYKCSWRGCDWGEGTEIESAPIFQDDLENYYSPADNDEIEYVDLIGFHKQCERCWRIKDDYKEAFDKYRERYQDLAERYIKLKQQAPFVD